MGKFITPTSGSDLLSVVRAGFIPALPRIPMEMMMEIVSFFRYYMSGEKEQEVLVNVYWDKQNREYVVDAPEQYVSKVSVDSQENPYYANEHYIHYMDIHSHNSMKAFFSSTDDKDEKATRLYTVIGRLDRYYPDIKTRISNGGKFLEIAPGKVFELVSRPFPSEWKSKVRSKGGVAS
jgi:PRTRC genetic system protein A